MYVRFIIRLYSWYRTISGTHETYLWPHQKHPDKLPNSAVLSSENISVNYSLTMRVTLARFFVKHIFTCPLCNSIQLFPYMVIWAADAVARLLMTSRRSEICSYHHEKTSDECTVEEGMSDDAMGVSPLTAHYSFVGGLTTKFRELLNRLSTT